MHRDFPSVMTLYLRACLALVGALIVASNHTPDSANAPPSAITEHSATATNDFLDSIGIVSTFPDRGQPLEKTVEMVRYGGFRWVRAGIEGLSDNGPTTMQTFLDLHEATGAMLNWGLVSGNSDVELLIETGRILADAGALLAFEGSNEPNNWAVNYQGERGGEDAGSWMAVARLQRDMYRAVSEDPVLRQYPVWSISEPGAQTDNVGLQFLTIPQGAETLMPAGTRYADYANVHNYIYHPHSPGLSDNKTWKAADPTSASRVDGLYGNFGVTWENRFRGYDAQELAALPRVTTETGVLIEAPVTEELHGLHLLNLYLAQFKRGYAYTSVYLLRDRTDEEGNQAFGFFRPDYTPRKAAHYLHNLTTILADERGKYADPGRLAYLIKDRPEVVHDLLLQRSDGTFQLVVWAELVEGEVQVRVELGEQADTITIYDPTIGTEPVRTITQTHSFGLTLSDHPVILEFSRGGN